MIRLGLGAGRRRGFGPPDFAIARRQSAQAAGAVSFEGLLFGNDAYWDDGTPTIMRVPPGFDFGRVRFFADAVAGANNVKIRDGAGATFLGHTAAHSAMSNAFCSAVSAPVSREDVASFLLQANTGLDAGGAWMEVEAIRALNPCAMVHKSVAQGIPITTHTPITFDTVERDTGGFRTGGAAEFVMPVALGSRPIRMQVSSRFTNATAAGAYNVLRTLREGNEARGMAWVSYPHVNENIASVVSAIVPADPGDVFSTSQYCSTSGKSVLSDDATWGFIEALPPDHKYVTLVQTTPVTLIANTPTAIPFGAGSTVSDDLGTHNEAVNNTQIVVPAGINFARVTFNLLDDPGAFTVFAGIVYLNNSPYTPAFLDKGNDTIGQTGINAQSGKIPVQQGDVIDLRVVSNSGHDLTGKVMNWITVEWLS